MSNHPILFSAPMVRALLDGRKRQTRRVIKPQPPLSFVAAIDTRLGWFGDEEGECEFYTPFAVGDRLWVREAHHRTDDSISSHLIGYDFANGPIPRADRHFVADVGDVQFFHHSLGGWGGRTSHNYPSIHMPRWASRLTLTVTDVRVQRVQQISEEDAWAEGCIPGELDDCGKPFPAEERDPSGIGWRGWDNARSWYSDLWDSLNTKPVFSVRADCFYSYPWEGEPCIETYRGKPLRIVPNPWVAAYTFTVHLGNIDEVDA